LFLHCIGHSAVVSRLLLCAFLWTISYHVGTCEHLPGDDLIQGETGYLVLAASHSAFPRRPMASVIPKLAGAHGVSPAVAIVASSARVLPVLGGLTHCGWLSAVVSVRCSSGIWAGSRTLDCRANELHHRRIARILHLAARAATCSMHHSCLPTSHNPLSL
jgi:hypothetical protein